MGKWFLAAASVLFVGATGCATMPQGRMVEIITDPPGAAILINGAYIGDSPIEYPLSSPCRWVGIANTPSGYDCAMVFVQAQPKSTMPGRLYLKNLMVNPSTMASNKIFVNMALEPVAPTQPMEMR